jgi:disulfide bond formation protein DsbB
MTQMTPPPAQPGPSGSEADPQFLPLHTTVVLLVAFAIGTVVGALAALTGVSTAGAVLAGLSAAGSTVPKLRSLIGQPPRTE